MKLRTMIAMMGGSAAPDYVGAMRLMTPVHRAAWLAAACKHGVLAQLRVGPRELGELAEALGAGSAAHAVLSAWLRHGCLLGEISQDGDRYRLRGRLARRLAEPAYPELAAFAEALVSVHVEGIFGALDHLREGRSLADLDASVVARVSELTAPALYELIDRHVPAGAAARLLELGCGAGGHLRYACRKRPELEAVGVELDAAVAARAQRAVEAEGFADRARVVQGDVRSISFEAPFEVVSMFNLLYYFPSAERSAVIARAAEWVAPGGALVLASSCRGGTLGNNMMDIWFSGMRETGPLPDPEDVLDAIGEAGLEPGPPERLLPGEEYYAFVGRRPA